MKGVRVQAERGAEHASLAAYQIARNAVGTFDGILVTLLTQGNAFAVAIISVPIVSGARGLAAASVLFFALVLSLFLFLANFLYWNLLKRSVAISKRIEDEHLQKLPDTLHMTKQLDQIPLSAGRGSLCLYLLLPPFWGSTATVLGAFYMFELSIVWGTIFLLGCGLVVSAALAVYGFAIRRVPPHVGQ